MKKSNINKLKGDEQISTMLGIKDSFTSNTKGIKKFVSHLKPVVEEADKSDSYEVIKALQIAYKTAGINFPKTKEESESITDEQKKAIYRNLKLPELKSPNQGYLLWKSNFVLLISAFEYLFADIISFYFKFYPNSALDKTVEVDLSELKNCSSIEEYIDIIISNKIEALLYKSIDKQLEFIEKEIKLDLEHELINWDIIKEATLRRHLIVHNDCRINKRYLKEADFSKVKDITDLKEGDIIMITPKYFDMVYQEIFLAGNLIIQNSFRKWLKKYEQIANIDLIDLTFDAAVEREFIVGEKIGKYGKRHNSFNNDFHFRINMNYCLALKGQGKSDEFQKEIKQIDISNLSPIYVVAYHAIQNDKINTLKHLQNAKKVDKLEWISIENWPLFEGLRKDKEFIEKARKIFKPSTVKNKILPVTAPINNNDLDTSKTIK
jgi:hypothetical protein